MLLKNPWLQTKIGPVVHVFGNYARTRYIAVVASGVDHPFNDFRVFVASVDGSVVEAKVTKIRTTTRSGSTGIATEMGTVGMPSVSGYNDPEWTDLAGKTDSMLDLPIADFAFAFSEDSGAVTEIKRVGC
jgi:hypothetical protein